MLYSKNDLQSKFAYTLSITRLRRLRIADLSLDEASEATICDISL